MTAMTKFEAACTMLEGTEATGIKWDAEFRELTIIMERGLIVLAEDDGLDQIEVSFTGDITVVK